MSEKLRMTQNETGSEVEKNTAGDTDTVLAATGLWRLINWQKGEAKKRSDDTNSDESPTSAEVDLANGDAEVADDDLEEAFDYANGCGADLTERAEVRESEMGLWQIELPRKILEKYDFVNELPDGIGIMGGVARSIAREVIAGETEPIRDIDLVEIVDDDGKEKVKQNVKDDLAKKFMPDDYQFGHGINSESLRHYMTTRDFTINQCLILGQKLIVSDLAYDDLQENIIRPTFYEKPFAESTLSSRIFMKALLLRATVEQFSESVPLLEDVDIDPYGVRSFDMALTLNKAMSRGAKVARTFTEDLADWDLIPAELADKPMELAVDLLQDVWGFEFRNSRDERFDSGVLNEASAVENVAQRIMQTYQPHSARLRQEMNLYMDNGDETLLAERERGYYTDEEFQEINRRAAELLQQK